jgi:hypothetical protein
MKRTPYARVQVLMQASDLSGVSRDQEAEGSALSLLSPHRLSEGEMVVHLAAPSPTTTKGAQNAGCAS